MENFIYYDIETYEADDLDEFLKGKNIRADARCTKDEAIAASIEKKRQALVDKAALSYLTGKVVCIAALHGDEEFVESGLDETEVLCKFRKWVDDQGRDTRLVGFNNRDFDSFFLQNRYYKNRLKVPRLISKRNDIDLMLHLCGRGADKRKSLDDFLQFFYGERKQFLGADIKSLVEAKDFVSVNVHALEDVYAVKKIVTQIYECGGYLV